MSRRFRKRIKKIRILVACLFLLYLVGLVYFLFFCEDYGRAGGGTYSYNLRPFQEIHRYLSYGDILGMRSVVLNLAGNVIGFMPFGMLVPILARGARRAWRTTLLSFELSTLVEMSQLIFQVGCFDVDDMILNTLGGLLGYGLFRMFYQIYLKMGKRA